MDSLASALLNEWYLFTGVLACGLAAGTLALSSPLAVVLVSLLVGMVLSVAVVVGGGDGCGGSSADLVISLSTLPVTLLPLLTSSLFSVVGVVSVLVVVDLVSVKESAFSYKINISMHPSPYKT